MIIGGVNFGLQPWPEPKTNLALGKWKGLGTGYQSARDRGFEQDIYESRVLISDGPAVIDSLQTVLNANRKGIVLSGFNAAEMIFGANVNYSGSINATVVDFGKRKNLYNDVLFDLEINFRAISPTLLATEPSLSGLKLQEKFEGDRSTDITKHFGYDGSASYLDHKTDAGIFTGRFLQTTEQMKAIRAYLLTVARVNAIPFPAMGVGVFRPFGANAAQSTFQKCNVIAWRDKPLKLNLWELEITFAQATPVFQAGEVDAEVDAGAFFFRPSDTEPLDFFMRPE